jgi:hypothetical protein
VAGAKPKEAQKAPAKQPSPSLPDTVKTAAKESVPVRTDTAKAVAGETSPPRTDATKAAAKETAPLQPDRTEATAGEESPPEQKLPENADAALPATSGVLTWSGELGRNSILVISGQGASIGSIVGQFPGKPVKVTVEPGTLVIRQLPGAANGWSQIILYSGNREYSSIDIRWNLVE